MKFRLLLGSAMLLAAPLSIAHAQVPGSYRASCSQVDQDGFRLSAICRAPGGRQVRTTLDIRRCQGVPVANNYGRLSCGDVQGSAEPVGGPGGRGFSRGYDDEGPGYRRPGPPRGYGAPDDDDRPPPPRRRYAPPPSDYDD